MVKFCIVKPVATAETQECSGQEKCVSDANSQPTAPKPPLNSSKLQLLHFPMPPYMIGQGVCGKNLQKYKLFILEKKHDSAQKAWICKDLENY